MRVWLITIGEPVPVDHAVQDRLHRTGYFARLLAEHGHDVVWWTSTFDHFRKRHVFSSETSLDRSPHLRIVCLHGPGYRRNVSLARLRDHRSLAASFSRRAREIAAPPDILVAALPTIELAHEAVRYGREMSVPVVLDMRDMWPDIFVDLAPSPLRPLARLMLSAPFRQAAAACAGATAITGITDAFVDWGVQRALRQRTENDRSFPMGYSSLPPDARAVRRAEQFWDTLDVRGGDTPFTACFIGTLGRQFVLESVLTAARLLKNRGSAVRFVICGSGDRSARLRRSGADLDNVLFPGWVDAASIHVLMRRSHVGLDPLSDRYDFLATINNKAIEYLSAGLPLVASPLRGELNRLIREGGLGRSYDVHDAESLADILQDLERDRMQLREMSARAARMFTEKFTAEKVYTAMMEYLELLAAAGAGRSMEIRRGKASA